MFRIWLIGCTAGFLATVSMAIAAEEAVNRSVAIQVQLFEIDGADNQAVGFDWHLGAVPASRTDSAGETSPGVFPTQPHAQPNSQSVRGGSPATLSGILSDPQLRAVIGALESRQKGARLLAAHEGVILSGSELSLHRPDGWAFEFLPRVSTNNHQVHLRFVVAQSKGEYAGYVLKSHVSLKSREAAVFADAFQNADRSKKKGEPSARKLIFIITPELRDPAPN